MKTTLKNSMMSRKTATHLHVYMTALLAVAFGLIGCVGESEGEETARIETRTGALGSSVQGDGAYRRDGRGRGNRDGMRNKKHGRRGDRRRDSVGPLFRAALEQDTLTAEQRATVEALVEKKIEARNENRGAAKETLRERMAQAVKAGQIDADAMKAHFEERSKRREARAAARAESLSTLYATLDDTQRKAVVADVLTRTEMRGDGRGNRGRQSGGFGKDFGEGKGAKGHMGKGRRGGNRGYGMGDGAGRRGGHRGFGRGGRHGGGMLRLVDELALTDEQQAQIETLRQSMWTDRPSREMRREERAARRQCHVDFLESFAGESFTPDAPACWKGSDEDREAWMNRHIANLNSLMEILTAEQREQLAERLTTPPAPPSKPRAI